MSQSIAARERPSVSPRGRTKRLRPVLMLGGIVLALFGSGAFWLRGGRFVSIDNAYVRADKLAVATDVSGIILDIPVVEGQKVAKGDVLFRLDPKKFQNALDTASADLAETALQLNAMKQDYERMLRDIAAKQAQVSADAARFERVKGLVGRGDVSRQTFDDARFQLAADEQAVSSLTVAAQVQLAKLGGDVTAPVQTLPTFLRARALVAEAQRQLDDATVRAPFDGIVTGVANAQPGLYLAASNAAFGLVATERMWVEANPKETDLTFVKPGDHVDVTVDTYPGRAWDGVVESIAPVSGSEFSILPAQNSSGNWVKVVQRITVHIRLEHGPSDPPLRAGMSVEAVIDTGHRRSLGDLL